MINKFARCASTYSYYGYLNRYNPEQLRKYQSERNYYLGRRGAFNNLVLKMAADHINYQEDFNLRYKVPPIVIKVSSRLAVYWFLLATLILSFGLGDMVRVFRQKQFYYPGRPSTSGEQVRRYQTLYILDRPARY